ncbi:type III secretion system export apparatus subunit SctS [Escherichia albertii]|uniref:type III secretion system export apparatus subunit SctS n=1 Tax=Escherichia albertii TaxID=208962 RepID=UPI0010F9FFF7|nr:type III secretion system export apparatus subunit SctS [Escherichia albertii]MCZ8687423.1 type III secretion system export apparatus subunit SctS [Escherichia albertii]MCZ8730144.1 type III secretion system export apparatus subunit SctS [Escherichia albertii]MCZ8882242.1 type III secretion system export apparatus subunit SctS [Escherichia albertii]MCZ8894756.1 type III secretion system export apparatus subunit SctS [Escherichia albertii]
MESIFYIGNKALFMVLILSAVPVMVATVVGILVALIQAITHIQEQTLPFGIKLLAVCAALFITAPWFVSSLKNFSAEVLTLAFQLP